MSKIHTETQHTRGSSQIYGSDISVKNDLYSDCVLTLKIPKPVHESDPEERCKVSKNSFVFFFFNQISKKF